MPRMETLKETFLEHPTIVYLALIVAELVLAGLWFKYRGRKKLLYMLIPPLLGLAAYAAERLVVTDREQIVINANEIARRIVAKDLDGIRDYLDEKILVELPVLGSDTATRDEAIAVGKAYVGQNPLQKIAMVRPKVEVGKGSANMEVATTLRFSGGEMKGQTAGVAWRLRWIKKDERWIIHQAEARQAKPGDLGLGGNP